MVTLREKYIKEVRPELIKSQGHENPMRVARIEKVIVNMGIGCAVDKDTYKAVTEDLARITGQRPLLTKARKSISNFKLREGMQIGAKVTLRGRHMYEFLDRLINAALPRIRDFRGLPVNAFDGHGNYSLGIKDQTIFPEIDPDNVKRVQGINVTIVTSTDSDDEAREMLRLFGTPLAQT